jgi:hypothetical protein
MGIAVNSDPRIVRIKVTGSATTAALADGRTVSVPLAWSWRLAEATAKRRQNFRIIGSSQGVRWPDADERISAMGMLSGTPALRPTALTTALIAPSHPMP